MDFNNYEKYRLDIKELKDIFCSPVYLENYLASVKNFIPESNYIITADKLKKCINSFFSNHYINFTDLPEKILAMIIHSGNVYLISKYLFEYFNEKNIESQTIMLQKIVLNLGHELIHALLRKISPARQKNFFITSNNKNDKTKKKRNQIYSQIQK